MDHAARARSLMERDFLTPAIDHALLAMRKTSDAAEIRELRWLVGSALEKKRMALAALPHLDAVLADEPDHARALASRGSAYDRLAQPERARLDLERATELDPHNAEAWELLANICNGLGDRAGFDAAVERLEQAGEVPGYLLQLRGKQRLDAGEPGAEADLREAVRKGDPMSSYYLREAGFELEAGHEIAVWALDRQKRGRYDEAIACYQQAIDTGIDDAGDDVRYRGWLIDLLVEEGRRDEAVAAAESLTDAHPERADAWLARAALDRQTSSFERAYALSPEKAAVDLARHHFTAGRTDEALELCKRRVEQDPDDTAALTLLGEVLMACGEPERAKETWRAAEALSAAEAGRLRVQAFGIETGLDHFGAALDCLDQNDRDQAAVHFDRAAELLRDETRVPGDEAHRYLAKSLYNSAFLREQRVPDEDIEPNLREATELDPTYTDPMLALGNLCLRTGRIEEGLGWFARVGAIDPSSGQAWYYRARHHASHGDPEAGIVDATKAFSAYMARGHTQYAADALMLSGRCNEDLGRLHRAMADYDRAYEYGHPTAYSMGDHIRKRIAIEDPSSAVAGELLEKIVEDLETGKRPWPLDVLEAMTAESDQASEMVQRIGAGLSLDADEIDWLVTYLYSRQA